MMNRKKRNPIQKNSGRADESWKRLGTGNLKEENHDNLLKDIGNLLGL